MIPENHLCILPDGDGRLSLMYFDESGYAHKSMSVPDTKAGRYDLLWLACSIEPNFFSVGSCSICKGQCSCHGLPVVPCSFGLFFRLADVFG
ncbi:MAG: hypothetical protein IJK52_01820 [Oscillospiraceae bacterium]|nr:hypothetical protein [Oscillospiraceae bacterium]